MPRVLHVTEALKGEPVALVAGGAGFLGSHLCEKLLETCRVICLDNLKYGKRENIARFLSSQNFTFIEYDITKPLADLLRKRVDYIFHVAGVDELMRHDKASLDDLLLNTYGTRNLLEKALSDKAKFLLVSTLAHEESIGETIDTAQARLFSESLTREYLKKFGVKGRIVRLGHVFGPRMLLGMQNPMSVIINELLKKGDVVLANDELTRIYPVFINDAVDAIVRIAFSGRMQSNTFNLLPKNSLTLFELTQLVPDIDPHFSLRFSKTGISIRPFSKEHFHLGVSIPVSSKAELVEQVKVTIQFFRENKNGQHERKNETTKRKGENGFSLRFAIFLFIASVVFFGIVLPFLVLGGTSILGVAKLNESYQAIKVGNFPKAVKAASISRQSFAFGQDVLSTLSYHFLLIGKGEQKEAIFTLLKTGEDASISSEHLAHAANLLGEFFRMSLKGEGLSGKPSLDKAIGELNAASTKLPLFEKGIEDVSKESLPPMLARYIEGRRENLSKQRETINLTRTLAGLLPDLLGFEDKRIYLVLFQNNMELRPGGGFIGSYGIVTFEKGSLISFEVFDVYQADGQLKGHVEPPAPIRKYLNQPNWFLRDSNWDIDFGQSSTQASWFLQKEVGTSVHGVIGIDVTFMQFLLGAVGPVSLPDYKETITADNLFEKAETHAESDFFPGSTQKKDFLGALSRRVIDILLHDDNVSWLAIVSAVQKGLSEKHLLFSLNNPAIAQIVNLNNWGGTILSFPPEEGRFLDFRMISEANLGVNKANAFLKRKVGDKIIIDSDGKVRGELVITYINTGPKSTSTKLSGTYENYLRTVFPQGTKLTAVAFDGKEATRSAKPADRGLEIKEATQSGRSIFGFFVSIPRETSKVVALSYELSESYPQLPGSSTYAYVFQKQPGTGEDSLSVMVYYPGTLRIKTTNASVFREDKTVTLSTDLSQDRLFEVEFVR